MTDFNLQSIKRITTVHSRVADRYLREGWTLLGVEKHVEPSGFGRTLEESVTFVFGWSRDEDPPDELEGWLRGLP